MSKWSFRGCALLIVGAILVGIGALNGAFAPVAVGEAIDAELGDDIEVDRFTAYKTSVPASEVSKLSIDLADADAYILASSGDEITVEYFVDKNERITVKCDGGLLSVVQSNTRKWIDYLHIEFGTSPAKKVKIYLPAALSEADIFVSSGNVDIEGIEITGDMDFVSSSGSLNAINSSVGGNLKARAASGEITVNGVNVKGDVSADSSSSEITFIMLSAEGGVRADTASGNVTMENCESRSLYATASSGSVNATQYRADEEINLSTSSGDINVNSGSAKSLNANTTSGEICLNLADAPEISLSAISGSITGTLFGGIGDYLVTSNTVSGDNSVPSIYSTAGNRKLTVSTTSGDIELVFAER